MNLFPIPHGRFFHKDDERRRGPLMTSRQAQGLPPVVASDEVVETAVVTSAGAPWPRSSE